MLTKTYISLALCGLAAGQLHPRQTQAPTTTSPHAAATSDVTAVSDCHLHGSQVFCVAGKTEFQVHITPTATTDVPAQFTGCHQHGSEMYCVGPDGEDVKVEAPATHDEKEEEHDHDHEGEHGGEHEEESPDEGRHCHFHAGVEHCTGGDETGSHDNCEAPKRDYNVGLRVGLLFVIMAASAIGVFAPIILQRFMPTKLSLFFTVLKQFGTGIIISTALVHLYTHASLMFGNECLGELGYEATTSAIVMAGLFLSFLVDFIGHRVVLSKTQSASNGSAEDKSKSALTTEVISILVMEAGILFHSLLIGLTLVVAGDSFFLTLFVVILFHQMFEGIALGTRIAAVGEKIASSSAHPHHHEDGCGVLAASVSGATHTQGTDKSVEVSTADSVSHRSASSSINVPTFPLIKKLGLAALFAFVTPIGMAIGIGVLQKFNGNDKSTLIAIGTLDALSAGILLWVGIVEMWAADWLVGAHGHKAELSDADILTVILAGFGLVAGLALMSLLGKWA